METAKLLAKLVIFVVAYGWMAKYDIPFWPRLGIGTLFITGAVL